MADLGHPVIGPQSLWKLTQAEIRVYAEGMDYQNERRKERTNDPGSPTSQSHDTRADDAFEKMDAKVRDSWNNDGYE